MKLHTRQFLPRRTLAIRSKDADARGGGGTNGHEARGALRDEPFYANRVFEYLLDNPLFSSPSSVS